MTGFRDGAALHPENLPVNRIGNIAHLFVCDNR